MIKSILKYIVMVLAVIAGVISADFIKGQRSTAAIASDTEKGSGHGEINAHGETDNHAKVPAKKSSKDDHGSKSSYSGEEISYLKFKRQFVVPVTKGGKLTLLLS